MACAVSKGLARTDAREEKVGLVVRTQALGAPDDLHTEREGCERKALRFEGAARFKGWVANRHGGLRSVELPVLRGPLLAREHDHARLDRRPFVERRRQVARFVLLRQHLVLVGIDCREERCGVRVARKERQ